MSETSVTVGNRLSKIYTRTGDDGTTGLGDGSRVPKDDPRVEAYGTVDELNSLIGAVLAHPLPADIAAMLAEVQQQLFDLGGELCIPGANVIDSAAVAKLENHLDKLNESLEPLKDFVMPGGSPAASVCHVARTVCRRAERRVYTLSRNAAINVESIHYLNRLSDLLFVMCRTLNKDEGEGEILWNSGR